MNTIKHIPLISHHPQSDTLVKQDVGCNTRDENGNAVCIVPQDGQTNGCGCQSSHTTAIKSSQAIMLKDTDHHGVVQSRWKSIREYVLFAIACITSPCCTPLLVPVLLSLIAGTPLALWLGDNIGWVYGGLTLISIVSFVYTWRWMAKQARQ